jgi:type I restriction enzyme S subunit
VRRADLHAASVRRPPLREQRAVARVLDLLDRRAALLRQLDAKLAGMARAMFQLVPTTRRVRVAELCARIGNGATPPRHDAKCWGGEVPWFRSGELQDGPLVEAGERLTNHALEETACRSWPSGATLVAMYASPTVGRLGLLTTEAAANQACCALVPRKEIGAGFLFHAMLERRERLQHLATGAVQQNVNQRVVREHEVEAPDARTARAFSERVAPLWRQRVNYTRELRKLAALRATVLPELVTGRLAVHALSR